MHVSPSPPAFQNSYNSTVTTITYSILPSQIISNSGSIPQDMQLLFEDIFRNILEGSVVFYTDDSKMDDGTYVGSAIYSPQLNLEEMYKLS